MDTNKSRLHWLDNLRWFTVILVLVYHVFYLFNNKGVLGGIGGFVADPKGQPQDVITYILYPWFMMLLFLVAGISAKYALDKHSNREFIASRTRKLLVPATIGLFVFQWMTGYFNIQIAGVSQGISDKISTIPSVARYLSCVFVGIGPLWFIQDLWIFSLLLVLIKKIDRNDRFWQWCGKINMAGIILLGVIVYLGQQTLLMEPKMALGEGLYNGYKPIVYFIPFLLGYFVFSHEKAQELTVKMHLPILVAAIVTGIVLVATTWGQDYSTPQYLRSILNNLYAWLMILAMLGCFKAWFDRTNSFATYMSRSSFGIYVVHYLVIVSLGYMMKVYTTLSPFAIYIILLITVLTISPLLYEIIRHIPFVRWCVLGVKK
ncbi:MAG: acyltransferase [Bacteroidales bacterium]|nr:acyltransferase [Bacteroidales bacterium]